MVQSPIHTYWVPNNKVSNLNLNILHAAVKILAVVYLVFCYSLLYVAEIGYFSR